jgi:hypothetical protein
MFFAIQMTGGSAGGSIIETAKSGGSMEGQKLLDYKRNENSASDKSKTTTASSPSNEKIPARDSRRFALRLDLAGNRFSPLHEW